MPDKSPSLAVLHLALNPCTGPWSVMRELARAQAASGRYAAVALGIVHDRAWPAPYRTELAQLAAQGLLTFEHDTPHLFGTASFLWQVLSPPGIERWIADLRRQSGAERVVVHCHNAWMTGVFLPLRGEAAQATICVATFHGVNAELNGQPVRHAAHRWMARRLLRASARLTTVDAGNYERAQRILGIPPDRFIEIPNGVPADTPRGCPFARGGTPFTLGHVGSITARKGWRFAAEAAIAVARTGRPVRAMLAGDGDEAADAAACAAQNPGVVVYRGFVRNPREHLMPQLDLLSVMSVQEGLPMTIIEAQSAGVPAAATAVGGIPQAVRPGESGYLIERTTEALARVVQTLHDDPAALAALSVRTRARFERQFAIDHVVALYHALYSR